MGAPVSSHQPSGETKIRRSERPRPEEPHQLTPVSLRMEERQYRGHNSRPGEAQRSTANRRRSRSRSRSRHRSAGRKRRSRSPSPLTITERWDNQRARRYSEDAQYPRIRRYRGQSRARTVRRTEPSRRISGAHKNDSRERQRRELPTDRRNRSRSPEANYITSGPRRGADDEPRPRYSRRSFPRRQPRRRASPSRVRPRNHFHEPRSLNWEHPSPGLGFRRHNEGWGHANTRSARGSGHGAVLGWLDPDDGRQEEKDKRAAYALAATFAEGEERMDLLAKASATRGSAKNAKSKEEDNLRK